MGPRPETMSLTIAHALKEARIRTHRNQTFWEIKPTSKLLISLKSNILVPTSRAHHNKCLDLF